MFYSQCKICGSVIPSSSIVCDDCNKKLKSEEFNSFMTRCDKCHYPLLGKEYNCPNCKRDFSVPIYSLSDYNGTYSRAILEKYKFWNDKSFARLIAHFFEKILSVLDDRKEAVIVPVPCSVSSFKKRGWDQMKEVAKHIDRKSIDAVINISKSEIQQKNLSKEDRAEYAGKKYSLNPKIKDSDLNLLKTRKVIILDDIVTTGETCYAVASVLKKSGASDICVASWLCEL